MENNKNIIEESLLFKDFKLSEIEILVKNSAFINFSEGEFLLDTQQEAKNFYFIISGSVSLQVFSHELGIVELENIQDNELLGWSWLTYPFINYFDAIAFKHTKALYFNATVLKYEMKNNYEFGYKIFSVFTPLIAERLHTSRKNILELYEKEF